MRAVLFCAFLIALFCGPLRAFAASEPGGAGGENWISIPTDSAGPLSLPFGWRVISKDTLPERRPESESAGEILRQVLHAQPENASADGGVALQVFSLWSSEDLGSGPEKASGLPTKPEESLTADLLNARYGRVRQTGRTLLNTELGDISMTTWEAGLPQRETRYGSVALFHGEKLVLVLIRYLPEREIYWQKQFETIVNRWVMSLSLIPRPVFDAPELLPLPEVVALPPVNFSAPSSEPPAGQNASETLPDVPTTAGGFFEWLPELSEIPEPYLYTACAGAVAAALFAILAIFAMRRRARKKSSPEVETEDALSVLPEESYPEESRLPEEAEPEETRLEAMESEVIPTGEIESEMRSETESEEIQSEVRSETESEIQSETESEEMRFEIESEIQSGIQSEATQPEETRAEIQPAAPSEPDPEAVGFREVYTLLNQAIDTIDSSENVIPLPRYYSNMEEDLPDFGYEEREVRERDVGERDWKSADVSAGEEIFASEPAPSQSDADDEPGPASPVSRLAGAYLAAFTLMALGDLATSLFFANPSDTGLLPDEWETILGPLGNGFLLMALSCFCALAVRFMVLRRPMKRGKISFFVALLTTAAGAGLFSLSVFFVFSVPPDLTVMRACALAASLCLSCLTLTSRRAEVENPEMPETSEIPEILENLDIPEDVFEEFPEAMVEPVVESVALIETEPIPDDGLEKQRAVEFAVRRAVGIFEDMERERGRSYVLETLQNEVLDTLSSEGGAFQILQAQEATADLQPDCFILQLSGGILFGLMRTGRYHVGRGILSGEGEELADLFRCVAERLARNGCGMPDDVEKMDDAMRSCIADLG
ncbi:MAG: hypothetical protein LBT15_07145 [Synergistaceae bacterium]|nr:hypothetical protein [Synergistaceae bacterium]